MGYSGLFARLDDVAKLGQLPDRGEHQGRALFQQLCGCGDGLQTPNRMNIEADWRQDMVSFGSRSMVIGATVPWGSTWWFCPNRTLWSPFLADRFDAARAGSSGDTYCLRLGPRPYPMVIVMKR